MAKPTIVTRATKGSALTWTEGDSNFTNLQNATVTLKADTGGTDVVSDLNGTVTLVAGSHITLTGDNTAKTITISSSGGGGSGIDAVVDDLTPQLGGNLDVNGNSIVSVSNGDITLAPNGTGAVVISGLSYPTADGDGPGQALITDGEGNLGWGDLFSGSYTDLSDTPTSITSFGITDGTAGQVLTTDGDGNFSFEDASGGIADVVSDTTPQLGGNLDVNGNSIVSTSNGNITLAPDGTGDVNLNADTVRIGDSGAEAILTTNGSGGLRISTNDNSTTGYIAITSGANGNITLEPNGTGDVFVVADTLRIGDQNTTANITTFGTGNLTLSTNNGTNTGSITIAQGVNGQMTLACNGSGVIASLSPQIIIGSFGDNNSAVTGRHQATASASDQRHSVTAQKQRTDILIAAMTDEPAVYSFSVRDSAAVNRTFGRWIGRYAGPSTNPSFELRGSPDAFTTNIHYVTFGGGVGTFGSTSSNYTLTSNTGGNLILTANGNVTSGTITIASGANGNITIAPNGTGDVNIDSDQLRIGDSGSIATIKSNSGGLFIASDGANDLDLVTNGGGAGSGRITITGTANGNISITPDGTGKTVLTNAVAYEYVYTAGSTTGTITPNAALGTIQSITLTGSITFNAFGTPLAGQTITMIITQPSSGGPYTLTSTMKFAGASKTLSTAANAVDILSVTYDGTNYWASLSKGYA
jgi:hypothetical protein